MSRSRVAPTCTVARQLVSPHDVKPHTHDEEPIGGDGNGLERREGRVGIDCQKSTLLSESGVSLSADSGWQGWQVGVTASVVDVNESASNHGTETTVRIVLLARLIPYIM